MYDDNMGLGGAPMNGYGVFVALKRGDLQGYGSFID
jgi:hypothetical protein